MAGRYPVMRQQFPDAAQATSGGGPEPAAAHSRGIAAGLFIGKPGKPSSGITLMCFIAFAQGVCQISTEPAFTAHNASSRHPSRKKAFAHLENLFGDGRTVRAAGFVGMVFELFSRAG